MTEYPWLRREAETSPAFDAFREYLRQGGDRSIRNVTEKLNKSHQMIATWSRKNDWVDRAAAYDSFMLQQETEGHVDELTAVRNRHLAVSNKLLDHLLANMERWPIGHDPSIRWTQAFAAATKAQQLALTLRTDTKTDGVLEEVLKKVQRLEADA